MESVNIPGNLLEQKLWQREKYWQAELFRLNHGVNSPSDQYCLITRGYRK